MDVIVATVVLIIFLVVSIAEAFPSHHQAIIPEHTPHGEFSQKPLRFSVAGAAGSGSDTMTIVNDKGEPLDPLLNNLGLPMTIRKG